MTERLRALLTEATPGPWPENAALIVAAINALPALLDVVDAARRLLVGSDGDEAVDLPDEEWDPIFLDLRDALTRLEDPQ